MNDKEIEFLKSLNMIARAKAKPFCYSCYKTAPTGTCDICHSDDLMFEVKGVGCEYGLDWIVKHILENEIEEYHMDEKTFMQSIDDIYGDTVRIGWLDYSTSDAIKQLDPVTFRIAMDEEYNNLQKNEHIVSFDGGNTFYASEAIERYIVENLPDDGDA